MSDGNRRIAELADRWRVGIAVAALIAIGFLAGCLIGVAIAVI